MSLLTKQYVVSDVFCRVNCGKNVFGDGNVNSMRIHLGSDHAGFDVKEAIKKHLADAGHEIIDHGALTYDPQDDYPAPCMACAKATRDDDGSLGFVFGGSGNGEQMAANCVPGVRAALIWNRDTAVWAREHNNAQIAAIGGRCHSKDEAIELADLFVNTPFSHDERHQRRIDLMAELESDYRHQ